MSPTIEEQSARNGSTVLAVRGLAFARTTAKGWVFGIGRSETVLREETFGEMRQLVAKLLRFRCAQSEDPRHPFFRHQPEKWMQSVLASHLTRLGYHLVPDTVYEQVPAVSGTERGLMDLLAVNSQGRLVVLELKASEDIHLPLQALDYWMRVHWHSERGDFERQGYFRDRALSPQPPLLLLVSPALQFHPTCEFILRYFSPTVEAVRIGLNENWRHDLQVIFRYPR